MSLDGSHNLCYHSLDLLGWSYCLCHGLDLLDRSVRPYGFLRQLVLWCGPLASLYHLTLFRIYFVCYTFSLFLCWKFNFGHVQVVSCTKSRVSSDGHSQLEPKSTSLAVVVNHHHLTAALEVMSPSVSEAERFKYCKM